MPLFSTPPRVAFRRPWPGTRRGLVLWLLSLVVTVIGAVNYIGTNPPPRALAALSPVLQIAPPTFWGWVFVLSGLTSAFLAYCHFDRDQIGYRIMGVLTGFWALAYVGGFIDSINEPGGVQWRTLGSAAIWFAFCAVLAVCAALPKLPLDFGRER